MQKIALFGGTFNPPHLGHLSVVRVLAAATYQVIVMPSGSPPHKQIAPGSATPRQRFEMCKLQFENLENVAVSDFEVSREGYSYTVDTLEFLQKANPEAEISLVVGSDMLFCLTDWKDYEKIRKIAKIIAFCRKKSQLEPFLAKAKELGAEVLEHMIILISSTELRSNPDAKFLNEKVFNYINEHHLYGT